MQSCGQIEMDAQAEADRERQEGEKMETEDKGGWTEVKKRRGWWVWSNNERQQIKAEKI